MMSWAALTNPSNAARFPWRLAFALMALTSIPAIPARDACGEETFTYSYSNLFDGQLERQSQFTEFRMLQAVEEALALWASVAPITFIELPDAGPPVTEDDIEYPAAGTPDIRIGHHPFSGNTLGHAYFPGNSGLSSDVHLDSSGRVWSESLFFTTVAHELGHALGLPHLDDELSLMNSQIDSANTLSSIRDGRLFPPEIAAIQELYGTEPGDVMTRREWAGTTSASWNDRASWAQNWQPTWRSNVEIADAAQIHLVDEAADARSITFGSGPNRLTIDEASRLNVSRNVTLGGTVGGKRLVEAGGTARYLVPSDGDNHERWMLPEFDDTTWSEGATGIGYDRGGVYTPQLATDVESLMYDRRNSIYVRLEFELDDPAVIDFLQLDLKFDDGFVAYLNGTQVVSENTPSRIAWNAAAPLPRSDTEALQFSTFDLSDQRDLLQSGQNILAIQALNNRVRSSDLLIVPQLRAGQLHSQLVVDGGVLQVGEDVVIADQAGATSRLEVLHGSVAIAGDLRVGSGDATIRLAGGSTEVGGRLALSHQTLLEVDIDATILDFESEPLRNVDSLARIAGLADLAGTLVVQSRHDWAERVPASRGQRLEWTILEAESLVGRFDELFWAFHNGHVEPLLLGHAKHLGAGRFQTLDIDSQSVVLRHWIAPVGDADGDGNFGSRDLVLVFQMGQYEDVIESNSDWTTGDWNLDGDFDSADLVAAFQSGGYESTARAVPESILCVGPMLPLLMRMRRWTRGTRLAT